MRLKNEKDTAYTFTAMTREHALTATMFYHKRFRNADGSPVRARRNGATKTWKTRPEEYRIPVKYGMYEYFYITHESQDEWAIAYSEVSK